MNRLPHSGTYPFTPTDGRIAQRIAAKPSSDAKRLECAELAPAFAPAATAESGSKLRALQTLRDFGNHRGSRQPALSWATHPGVGGYYTLSRERHVEVDGKVADAVLGRFQKDKEQFVAVLEGKGARDPLDRPFAGRRMSAVDQAYRYAINLPCDWIIVTSMRETRLYHKGSPQNAYECFETTRLASEPALLKRFVFLLGAERVVPEHRD